MKKMKVLVVDCGTAPYVKEIEPTLKAMQSIVGGLIEPVYINNHAIIVNEEGIINNLPFNRILFLDGNIVTYLFGTVFICGLGDEDFSSLDDDSIERYSRSITTKGIFIDSDPTS